MRWYRDVRRELPWRRTREPYAVWISEAMLQQTRVEVVVPYYERFLARFPDVGALAAADEQAVLAAWSGLGYYSRARALRSAARALVREHAGVFPRTRAAWLALPGVGPYTAGAVLSIAFGAREALVDGNVQRVFARLFALEEAQGSKELGARCWELARVLLPPPGSTLDAGDWNQALMELGALVCTPRAPRCAACPLRTRCRAHAQGRASELPRARARPVALDVELEILVVGQDDAFLLLERPSGGRMAGLLEFPTRELAPVPPLLWPARFAPGLGLTPGAELGELTHTITRHRIRARVRAARLAAGRLPSAARWVPCAGLAARALSGLARKVLSLEALRAGPVVGP